MTNSNNPKNLKDEIITNTLQEILFEIRQVYNYFVGDVSVHIKLKEIIDNEDFLRTLYREPSSRDEGTGELFKVFNHTSISALKNLTLKKSVINDAKVRVNSAYNEVLLNPTQNWLCTDLNKAEEKNLYYSTSSNWKVYYKSLAIFPITDRYSYDEEKNMKGILIIDSKYTECFPPEITKQIGGLLAHRLNHIFSLTDVYEKYFTD